MTCVNTETVSNPRMNWNVDRPICKGTRILAFKIVGESYRITFALRPFCGR